MPGASLFNDMCACLIVVYHQSTAQETEAALIQLRELKQCLT